MDIEKTIVKLKGTHKTEADGKFTRTISALPKYCECGEFMDLRPFKKEHGSVLYWDCPACKKTKIQ